MKANLYLGLAATALALASCAQDEVMESAATSDANAIRFTTTSGKFSRAASGFDGAVTANGLDKFDVWASTKEGKEQFILDKTVKSDEGGIFTFDDGITRYWPLDETLVFAAYRNDQETFNGNALAPAFNGFEVKTTVASQSDLVYATAEADREDGLVSLNFEHALSQVLFTARVTNPTLEVVVHQVTLGHLNGKGNFTVGTKSWSDLEGIASYTVDSETGADFLQPSTTFTPLTSSQDNTMLVIPQALAKWNKTEASTEFDGSYVGLDCSIYNVTTKADGTPVKVKVHEGYTYLPLEYTLERGMRYTFNLSIGDGMAGWDIHGNPTLAGISLTVTSTDFKEASNADENRTLATSSN